MKIACVALAVLLMASASAAAQTAPPKASDDRTNEAAQIRQIESDWSEAGATGECVEQRILGDDFLGTDTQGKLYTKADKVRECGSKGREMVYDHLAELRVRFFGDVAVAHGSENWKRKDGKTGKYVWTDVLVKRDGRWQIVAAQDVIPPEP